jgi:hypothetical protein
MQGTFLTGQIRGEDQGSAACPLCNLLIQQYYLVQYANFS